MAQEKNRNSRCFWIFSSFASKTRATSVERRKVEEMFRWRILLVGRIIILQKEKKKKRSVFFFFHPIHFFLSLALFDFSRLIEYEWKWMELGQSTCQIRSILRSQIGQPMDEINCTRVTNKTINMQIFFLLFVFFPN